MSVLWTSYLYKRAQVTQDLVLEANIMLVLSYTLSDCWNIFIINPRKDLRPQSMFKIFVINWILFPQCLVTPQNFLNTINLLNSY